MSHIRGIHDPMIDRTQRRPIEHRRELPRHTAGKVALFLTIFGSCLAVNLVLTAILWAK